MHRIQHPRSIHSCSWMEQVLQGWDEEHEPDILIAEAIDAVIGEMHAKVFDLPLVAVVLDGGKPTNDRLSYEGGIIEVKLN